MNFKKRVNGSWTGTPHYIMGTSTDTLITLPAVLYPNAVTATVGLKGQMEQSGTPTPTDPIQPQECGDKMANLIYNVNIEQGGWYAAAGIIPDKIGNINRCRYSYYFAVESLNLVYDFKDLNVNIAMIDANGISLGGTGFNTGKGTIMLPNEAKKITLIIANADPNETITPEIVQSKNISLDYGYKIPILSNSTTTPVYLGEVESTRRIKKLVLTGEETFDYVPSGNINRFRTALPSNAAITDIVSTHYKYEFSNAYGNAFVNSTLNIITICDDYSSGTDFKAFLAAQYAAGTPVCVWYVLATPTTGIVNEPIRKIGDYADTVSDITIPTITGADSFDVLTTLKPSEVELTYTGWHDATVEEWDGSEWQ